MSSKNSTSRKRRLRGPNLLDFVPVRNPDFKFHLREKPAGSVRPKDPGTAGTVSIEIPRFMGRLGMGLCKVARVSPKINVNLDAYGSFVWLLIDGKTSVRDIGLVVKEEFGEKVDPLYGRLAHFLSILERNKLLFYTNLIPGKTEMTARKR